MPRPRGEVRQALAAALEHLHQVQGAASARELAVAAKVNVDHAEKTLERMEEAREVKVVGHGKRAGARWHNLYEPAGQNIGDTPQPWGGIEALAEVMRSFPSRES